MAQSSEDMCIAAEQDIARRSVGASDLRRWQVAVLATYGVAALAAVVTPMTGDQLDVARMGMDWRSLLSIGWLADLIRNLVLFAPFGAALAASGRRPFVAVAIGAALSLAIELVQLAIPGRIASPLDLVANTLGTAMGVGVVHRWNDLVRPPPELAIKLSLTACAVSAGFFLSAVWLLQPVQSNATYFGGWTLELGQLEQYQGTVLEARVGTAPIMAFGPVPDTDALRRALASKSTLFIRAIAGPPTERLAPLVTIHDSLEHEILLVGIDGTDLVIRHRLA